MLAQALHPSDVTINSCINAATGGQWLLALEILAAHGAETLQLLVIRYEKTILAALQLGSETMGKGGER